MMSNRSYTDLINRLESIARFPSVRMEILGEAEVAGRTYSMMLMHLGEPDPGKLGVTISAGMHGDEPAGVEAALRFMEANARNEGLLSRFHFIIFPCDNPSGCVPFLRYYAKSTETSSAQLPT